MHCYTLTKNVEHEADESMISGKRQEEGVYKDNMLARRLFNRVTLAEQPPYLEIVDDTLSVQEVISDDEEIPRWM